MASHGLGKIKYKKNKDAGKPYARPKSLLGRVSSTLRDLLTPLWSPWQSTFEVSSNEEVIDEEFEEEEAQDVAMEMEALQTGDGRAGEPVRGPPRSQGPSLDLAESSIKTTNDGVLVECDGYQATFDPSILDGDRNALRSVGLLSSVSRPPLSSAFGDYASLPRSEMKPTMSSGSSGPLPANYGSAKRSAPLHSGDDVSSGAREALRPEMVGAPSKKRCVERNNMRTALVDEPDEEPVNETSGRNVSGGEQSFRWQTSLNPSSASASSSMSRPAPSASTGMGGSAKKPGFDLGTFRTTINHSEQGQQDSSLLNSSYKQSPFYTGKTRYGGASARSKHVNRDADYQVVPAVRRQVTIETATNSSNQVPMSATAQRILEGLNRTEQYDDATVPSFRSSLVDSPLSFTPTTYKRNSLQASGSKTQLTLKVGPPVREMTTPTVAVIRQSIQTYQIRQPDETAVVRPENADRNVARSLMNAPVSYDLPSAAPSTHGPGKMRREQTRKHYSNRTTEKEEETPMVVDLPRIPLPVTNLQPFTSNTISSAGLFGRSSGTTEPEKASAFTFSSPIMMNTESKPTKDVRSKSFHFRSPIDVDDHRSNGTTPSSAKQPTAPTSAAATSEPASKSSLAFNFNLAAAVKKPQPSSEAPSIGYSVAAGLKRGSVMDLLGTQPSESSTSNMATPSSSVTSSASKTVSPAAGVVTEQVPLSKLFSKKWACPGCLFSNNDDLTVCSCCEERRPGAKPTVPVVSAASAQVSVPVSITSNVKPLSELFKPSSDALRFPSCVVTIANSQSRSPGFDTKIPDGSKADNQPSANSIFSTRADASAKSKEEPAKNSEVPKSSNLPSLSALFQRPPGDWVCPICSVPNKEHQLQCIACEEPKPGAQQAPSNGAISTAPMTLPSVGQVEAQGFSFNPGAFGNSATPFGSIATPFGNSATSFGNSATPFGNSASATRQVVFKAPSTTYGVGIVPSGGFRMSPPPGGFSGFGSGSFSTSQSQSDKKDSVPSSDKKDSVPSSGGFKPPGCVSFGQAPSSDTNGLSRKPEVMSFLPPASSATTRSDASLDWTGFGGGVKFGGFESKQGGFAFKTNTESETRMKAPPPGFSGFWFGGKVDSDKNVEDTGGMLLRPPLRTSEDKTNENCKLNTETIVGSSSQNNNISQTTVGIFGSTSAALDRTTLAPPVSSAPSFSFGVPATSSAVSSSVVSSSVPLFGLAKPSTDVSGPKFTFAATPGSTPVPVAGFGAPSTSLTSGAMQPVFTAPSSITSASVAPPVSVSAAVGFFAQPAMPVNKPAAQDAAKPALFGFGQNPTDAVPALFQFGEGPPAKEEVKPSASSVFQFGQTQNTPASSNLFQFGSSSSTAVSGAGIFNSNNSQSAAAAPVFGQPAAAATASGIFSFGAGSGAQSNPAGGFTFGAKPPDAVPKPDVTSSIALPNNKRSMDDDGIGSKRGRLSSDDMPMQDAEPMQSPRQPSVGFSFNPQPSGFAFNAPQAAASNTGFFGARPANPVPAFGNPSTVTTPAGVPQFGFTGQQQPAPAPAFGSQNASNVANGGSNTGFSFAAGAMAQPAPAGFTFSSAPSFNFSATSSNPSGNLTFNAQPSGVAPAGRTIKKAIRRTTRK